MNRLLHLTILIAAVIMCVDVLPGRAAGTHTPPTITAGAYDEILAGVQSRLHEEIDGDSTSGTRATALLKPDALCIVKRSDGIFVVTHNEWIIADVADAESETDPDKHDDKIDQVVASLGDVRSQLAAKPAATRDQLDAVAAARKLLSSDVYGSDPVQPPTGIERELKKFQDWLNKKMDVKGPSVSWPSISIPKQVWIGLLIVLGVVVVGLIGWLIVVMIVSRSGMPGRPRPEALLAMTDEEADLVASRSYDKLLDLANQRAETGDYRVAFRLVYLATLVSLDSAGLVRLNRSRTNWEYLRDLRNGPHRELSNMLRPMTVDFDRIWYGFAHAGRPEFERALGHHEDIKAAMRRYATAPGPSSPFATASLGNAKR